MIRYWLDCLVKDGLCDELDYSVIC